jgi:hypothetical protein
MDGSGSPRGPSRRLPRSGGALAAAFTPWPPSRTAGLHALPSGLLATLCSDLGSLGCPMERSRMALVGAADTIRPEAQAPADRSVGGQK